MNTKQDDGGPAFPFVMPDPSTYHTEQGMSLRDYFAAQSINGVIVTSIHQQLTIKPEDVALNAYRIADAMIAERKEGA
jgi:hypothetical protein